jgi:hypothetical protein
MLRTVTSLTFSGLVSCAPSAELALAILRFQCHKASFSYICTCELWFMRRNTMSWSTSTKMQAIKVRSSYIKTCKRGLTRRSNIFYLFFDKKKQQCCLRCRVIQGQSNAKSQLIWWLNYSSR